MDRKGHSIRGNLIEAPVSRDQRTVPRDTGNRVCPDRTVALPSDARPDGTGQIAGTLPLGTVLDDRASPCPTHRITAPRHGRACLPGDRDTGHII